MTVRGAECQAIGGRALHGFHDLRMRVTQDQRPPGHAEVEVTIAVLVDHVRAARLLEEHRRTADLAEGAHRARNAGGNHSLGAREQAGRPRQRQIRRAGHWRRRRG
jgi:hypothetical protein